MHYKLRAVVFAVLRYSGSLFTKSFQSFFWAYYLHLFQQLQLKKFCKQRHWVSRESFNWRIIFD